MNYVAIHNAIKAYYTAVQFDLGDEAVREAARKLRDLLSAGIDAPTTPAAE